MRVPVGTGKKMAFRKHLSIQGALEIVRGVFEAIADIRDKSKTSISLADALMSALAMFSMKCASLLEFDHSRVLPSTQKNLQNLFSIENVPSDTQMRAIIDDVLPDKLMRALKMLFSLVQRGKELESFKMEDGSILISVDGTGYFSSKSIRCSNCCEKEHKNGSKTFYHHMLSAVVISPNKKEVIPIGVEEIAKQDGSNKNDCERNASARLLADIRRQHPHLKITITEDGLASNGPHVTLLKSLNMSFILGCKADDHKALFETLSDLENMGGVEEFVETDVKQQRRYRYTNDVMLNDSYHNLRVGFLEYWEKDLKSGKTLHFSWITDKTLSKKNVFQIMRAGRSRWRIENETFNTLKNQGYNFEHNFGHGHNHLSYNLAILMFIAFGIDEIQKLACPVFEEMRKILKTLKALREAIRIWFFRNIHQSWQDLYLDILTSIRPPGKPSRS